MAVDASRRALGQAATVPSAAQAHNAKITTIRTSWTTPVRHEVGDGSSETARQAGEQAVEKYSEALRRLAE